MQAVLALPGLGWEVSLKPPGAGLRVRLPSPSSYTCWSQPSAPRLAVTAEPPDDRSRRSPLHLSSGDEDA